jgi:rare lipoprotein A (peptidoglycan hydrolase)
MRHRTALILSLLALIGPASLLLGASPAGAASPGGAAAAPDGAAPVGATPAPASKVHTTGVATWFGPGFYGHKTACGQTLTPLVEGVAHRTLPCGTLVKVTYAGHSVVLPVLDRGPYSHIAEWDLTAGAAAALGVADTVRIGTRVVGTTPNVPTLGLPAEALSAGAAGGALAG